jgi:3-oxoacyl-[acyl-carrier protein] reductase
VTRLDGSHASSATEFRRADGRHRVVVTGMGLVTPLGTGRREVWESAVLGPLDALVANAGITRDGLAVRMSDEDWRAVLDTNLSGAFFTIRPALRGMLKRRAGTIVAVSSVVGITGNPGQVNYAAAKAGIIGMVKALAREAGPRGVRVNAVAPGYIATDMTSRLSDDQRAHLLGSTPLGRLGTPEDVAAAVAFLCSDGAAYITGTVLPVDGGLVA